MKFSILGNGFVGNALFEGMKHCNDISIYDVDSSKSNGSFEDALKNEIIFVCLPTPTNMAGEIDTSIIIETLKRIESSHIIVIKSTITPNACQHIVDLFPKQEFVVNPEFLTERTAVEDFKNPSRIVLGGNQQSVAKIIDLYRPVFPDTKIIECDHKTACFIKFFSNCFFASKVSLMNEFRQIADANNIDWEKSLDGILSSGWVNPMHTLVPGPDGDYGFGGKCFPKDINAMIAESKYLNIEPSMLQAAWDKNLEVRKNKNWLQIEGAFSNKGEENE